MSGPQRMRGENLRDLMSAIRDGTREDWRRRPRPNTRGARPVGYCRWRGRLPIPKHAHPLVRELYRAMNAQQTTLTEVATRAGMKRQAIADWGRKHHPRVSELEAALNVLGLRLAVEEMPDE